MILIIYGILKKSGTNKPIYKTEIESQMQKTNSCLQNSIKEGRNKLREWDLHIHTTRYKIDNQ